MSKITAIAAFLAAAATATAGDFEIKSAAPLSVTFKGVPLIANDTAIPELVAEPDITPTTVPGWDSVYQVWGSCKESRTRTEVAASADRFEFTFLRLVEADVHGFVRYAFFVPHEFLDGRQAEIVGETVAVPREYVEKRHIAGPLGAGAIRYVKNILYLRVHHPAGAIDLDFSPRGWWKGQKTCTPRAADWAMKRTNEGYMFWTAFSRTIYGTLQEFKFVIRPADERPVTEIHPRVANRWTTPYPNRITLNFGALPVKGHMAVPNEKAQWRNVSSVRPDLDERFRDMGQTRYEGVSPANPEQPCVLDIDVGRPGYYLLNMLVGASGRAIGPCEVSAGEKHRTTCPAVSKGAHDSWALVAFAENGRIPLKFHGDFRLAAIGIAPMMYENEDFLFRRTWWISPEWNPEGDLLGLLLPSE